MRLLCWLGFHRFPEYFFPFASPRFGDVLACQRCGTWFRLVRRRQTDAGHYERVRSH